jgi:hypothetical protein
MKRIISALTVIALCFAFGCATMQPLISPALGAAACATVQKYPQSTPFVASAGEVFTIAGRDTPPTAAALAAALARIPGSDINALYASAIWQGAVVAYDALYSSATTPEAKAKLQATLTGIGAALTQAAVSCGPPPTTGTAASRAIVRKSAPASAVMDLAAEIEKQFKRK